MKLIEKFMLKRCSTEVQLMLTRMKERPEDFDYGTGWRNLIEVADNGGSAYTNIERKMIRKYWKACQHTRQRNELLGRIMSETINPTTRDSLENNPLNKRYAQALAASMQNTTQVLRGGITNIGGPPTTGQLGQYQSAYNNAHNYNPYNSGAPHL